VGALLDWVEAQEMFIESFQNVGSTATLAI
jgi:hypothetical protein